MRESEADGLPMAGDTERELLSVPAGVLGSAGAALSGLDTDCDPILELLVRWEEGHARGEDPTPETLCGDALHWLPALRERIDKRKRLRAILAMPSMLEADEVEPPLPEIPGHEVLGRLGRGGMGLVYQARDIRLGRIVALKTLAAAQYASREQLERFVDEARAVARLRHPNIVAIHAIGEHEGRPYLSLEFVEGGSLAQRLAEGPMAPRPSAELVELLALAIEAAHRAGVVHRDLKPGNVLLTAEGVPKVGDFGLAKLIDSDSALTCSGQVMGTPSYMAPEQAEGHSARVGPPADVYALGAILYQALTGRPPFLGDAALETIKLVATTEPVAPTRLRPDVPRDLETICLKCLEKEPGRRYASAAALADDLRRFLDGRTIQARPVGASGRLVRWAGRNRRLAAVSAVLATLCVLGTPAFLALWLRADQARGKAITALAAAEQAHRQAEAARRRAELSRDRALHAINAIVSNENGSMGLEEARPYRAMLASVGLHEAQELVRGLEDDPEAEIQVIFAYLALAAVQREAGQVDAGAESGRKALALAEALDARRHSEESRGMLAATWHRLVAMPGSPEEIRDRARRSNAILEAMDAEKKGGPMTNAHAMALNHYNIGHTLYNQRRLSEAATAFESAVRVCEAAIRRGDQDGAARLDLARSLVYLCRVRLGAGELAAAIEPGRRAIATYQGLLEQSPGDDSLPSQLYLAHEELGFVYQGLKRWDDVFACHQASRAMLKAAAERRKGVVSLRADLLGKIAIVDFNLANAYGIDYARNAAKIRELFTEAYDICDKLELIEPLSDLLKTVLMYGLYQQSDFRIEDGKEPDPGFLERAERVCDELCVHQPRNPDHRAMRVMIRLERADELEALGRSAEARTVRESAFAGTRGDGAALFDAAVVAAGNAMQTGTYPTRLDAHRLQERRQMFVRRAVLFLRRAVAEGFRDAARLRNTPELAILADQPEFRAMVASLDDRVFPADPFATRP